MDSNQALKVWKKRIESGDKNIALSNVGHIVSQQKYLLAILSYLASNGEMGNKKIGLVSFDLQVGLYKNHFNDYFPQSESAVSVLNKMGSYFIDWNLLIQKNIPTEFLSSYDLLLWDLPDLNFINSNSHSLERFFSIFDSMLIVSMRPNGIGDQEYIQRIHSFYKNHGLVLPKSISGTIEGQSQRLKMSDRIRRVIGI